MSVRGLPKGRFFTGTASAAYGTVTPIDAYGDSTHNTNVVISSMAADEFTLITAGVCSNNYMYSVGVNENDLEMRTLCIGHHGANWQSLHLAYAAPLPGYANTHGTTVNVYFGSTSSPGWCRARFRKETGFQGLLVAAQRYNQGTPSTSFSVTPYTNPMTTPGGLCVFAAMKDDGSGYWPDGMTGTGWTYAANGTYSCQGYYILSGNEIETPPTATFTSPNGAQYWAGVMVYLR